MAWRGNPHVDPTRWDLIKNDPIIKSAIARASGRDAAGSASSAIRDWLAGPGKSRTHDAAKAAGFTGDQAGAADLLLHYQLGKFGRWANRNLDRSGWKNIYDNIRDAQIDAWNERMGSDASYENLIKDMVNNPEDWEFRRDPVQDPAQKKGLEGRRLDPYKQIGRKPPTSGKKFRYGEESKFKGRAPKRESAYQREQRKRKEEEEAAFQESLMRYNQMSQNAISRPSIVPPVIWDAYVPEEGMSNYSVFDDTGRFGGIDMDAMLESIMDVGPRAGYSKGKV